MPLYLGTQKIKNVSIGAENIGITGVNTDTTTNITGILKGENSRIAQATPDVDYLTPSSLDTINSKLNTLGSLATKDTISASDLDSSLQDTINNPTAITDTNSLLAETRIALGGALAASAHSGAHAPYATGIQVDAFKNQDLISSYEGVYFDKNQNVKILNKGLSSGAIYANPTATHPNSFNAHTVTGGIVRDQTTKIATFQPDQYGILTKIAVLFNNSMSYSMSMQLLLKNTKTNETVLATELQTFSGVSTVTYSIDNVLLDPNINYALYTYAEDRGTTMARIDFTITPKIYSEGQIISSYITDIIPNIIGAKLLIHSNNTNFTIKYYIQDKQEIISFIEKIPANGQTDYVNNTKCIYTLTSLDEIDTNISKIQLQLNLQQDCIIYDYALIQY